jgi:L,D-peptidoglycan transpeptidase YkuD (ErfK/YbiS/YcfS/YnhG family)
MASRDRTTSPTPARWVVAVLCVANLAACTSSHPSSTGAASTPAVSSPPAVTSTPAVAGVGSPTSPTPSSVDVANSPASGPSPLVIAATPTPSPSPRATATPKPTPTKSAVPTPTRTSSAPTPLLVQQLANVGNAQQVVIVTSSSWSTDVATLQTFEKDATGWRTVFPAMAANIGRDGFSADKHEGDLRTPAGKYGFGTMFGQHTSPGVKFPYRVADSQSVWVDSPSSPLYNTWQENAALTGEHLAAAGFKIAYAYAVDIAYNTNPVVPGKGSAIFLHVSTGGGTAGCVSIAQPNLLEVLRWLDPARAPIIVMGPTAVIRQY